MLGWATGDSIVSDVAKDHALLTKFFFPKTEQNGRDVLHFRPGAGGQGPGAWGRGPGAGSQELGARIGSREPGSADRWNAFSIN